jgi:hypothetical protein
VVGILSYAEAIKIPFEIKVLAINERAIQSTSGATDTEAYFKDKLFYYCQNIDNGSTEVYVIWDEIINFDKTTILETEFEYRLKIVIPTDADYTIASVIQKIQEHLLLDYANKVTTTIQDTGSTVDATKSDREIFQEKIDAYEAILMNLKSIDAITPTITKLVNFDIASFYTSIKTQLETINQELGSIAAALK